MNFRIFARSLHNNRKTRAIATPPLNARSDPLLAFCMTYRACLAAIIDNCHEPSGEPILLPMAFHLRDRYIKFIWCNFNLTFFAAEILGDPSGNGYRSKMPPPPRTLGRHGRGFDINFSGWDPFHAHGAGRQSVSKARVPSVFVRGPVDCPIRSALVPLGRD